MNGLLGQISEAHGNNKDEEDLKENTHLLNGVGLSRIRFWAAEINLWMILIGLMRGKVSWLKGRMREVEISILNNIRMASANVLIFCY